MTEEQSAGTQEIKESPREVSPEEKQKEEMKIAKQMLTKEIYGNYLGIVAIIPSIYIGVCTILTFYFYGNIITALSEYEVNGESKMNKVMHQIYWMIGTFALYAITKFADKYFWELHSIEVTSSLKRKLFKKMMKSDACFFDSNSIGSLLTVFNEDAEEIRNSVSSKAVLFQNIAQFLTGIIFAFVYSWKLALVGISIIPVSMICVSFITPCLMKTGGMQFMAISKVMTFAEERISYIRTVRSFNREQSETGNFYQLQTFASKLEKKANFLGQMMFFIIMTFVQSIVLVVFFYGTHIIDDSKKADGSYGFTVGDLFATWGFIYCGVLALITVQGSMQSSVKAINSISRYIKLLGYQSSVPYEDGETPDTFNGEIEFKNVSFRYPSRQDMVLKNVSFKIPKGKTCALVGKSGSGKSTCIQLLERYYEPTEGEILIDGKNIKEINPRWIHQNLGIVPQEATLFAKTIRDNVTYGTTKAVSEEQLENTCELANISKFINTKLEQKYETFVGDKGVLLSGGQKQRLAIARALIKDPKVFIFDEATSAHDVKSEKKIQESLNNILKEKTSIIIAHRLSTIKNADIIYVFSDGEIIESGTNDELLEQQGFYYKLVYRQL